MTRRLLSGVRRLVKMIPRVVWRPRNRRVSPSHLKLSLKKNTILGPIRTPMTIPFVNVKTRKPQRLTARRGQSSIILKLLLSDGRRPVILSLRPIFIRRIRFPDSPSRWPRHCRKLTGLTTRRTNWCSALKSPQMCHPFIPPIKIANETRHPAARPKRP